MFTACWVIDTTWRAPDRAVRTFWSLVPSSSNFESSSVRGLILRFSRCPDKVWEIMDVEDVLNDVVNLEDLKVSRHWHSSVPDRIFPNFRPIVLLLLLLFYLYVVGINEILNIYWQPYAITVWHQTNNLVYVQWSRDSIFTDCTHVHLFFYSVSFKLSIWSDERRRIFELYWFLLTVVRRTWYKFLNNLELAKLLNKFIFDKCSF